MAGFRHSLSVYTDVNRDEMKYTFTSAPRAQVLNSTDFYAVEIIHDKTPMVLDRRIFAGFEVRENLQMTANYSSKQQASG